MSSNVNQEEQVTKSHHLYKARQKMVLHNSREEEEEEEDEEDLRSPFPGCTSEYYA